MNGVIQVVSSSALWLLAFKNPCATKLKLVGSRGPSEPKKEGTKASKAWGVIFVLSLSLSLPLFCLHIFTYIHINTYLCVCTYMHICIYVYELSMSTYLPIYLLSILPVCLYLSIFLSIYESIYLSPYLPAYCAYLSIYYLSVCLSTYPCTYLRINMYVTI